MWDEDDEQQIGDWSDGCGEPVGGDSEDLEESTST